MKSFLGKLLLVAIATGGVAIGAVDSENRGLQVSDMVIVVPDSSDCIKRFAASELKKHLDMVSGSNLEIVQRKSLPPNKYPVFAGFAAPDDKKQLAPEEARYSIRADGIYIYGDDRIDRRSASDLETVLDGRNCRTGSLFAAYFFLENEFGIIWIEPGDKGIVFNNMNTLKLGKKKFSWVPALTQRKIRPTVYARSTNTVSEEKLKDMPNWLKDANKKRCDMGLPSGFAFTETDGAKRSIDGKIWLKRMKMGSSVQLNYGHAFINWWYKYAASHPDFFALDTRTGKREPVLASGGPERIKLCVSNPELHKKIVEQWYKKKTPCLNACENDSAGYCSCPACLALDVKVKGADFGTYMTDRYVWFANRLLALACEKKSDVRVVMYAYEDFLVPPSREKVSQGIVIGIVPANLVTDKDELEKLYKGWKNAGAVELFMRPNDMNLETVMPMGLEEKLFEGFQIGIENGIFGTDYDRIGSCWGVSGMADYILARAHCYPEKSFVQWEDEYCSAYGAAKDEIREYYRYWRKNIWEKRIYPEREAIKKAGRYGNFRRGLMWKLSEYYKIEDFDETDRLLQKASSKDLTANERERLERLMLVNRHSRLTYEAITGNKDANCSLGKINAARALLKFRNENALRLQMDWPLIFAIEKDCGDLTGIMLLEQFQDKLDPVTQMPSMWRFKIDPDNLGLNEKWQYKNWKEICASWENIRIGMPWTRQKNVSGVSGKLKEQIDKYKGIGWYAIPLTIDERLNKKKIYLSFGAVDKSCWVYVNGREVGSHVYKESDDWKTPFSIRIDEGFSPEKTQMIIIRTASGNLGGIWKPVFLAVGKK